MCNMWQVLVVLFLLVGLRFVQAQTPDQTVFDNGFKSDWQQWGWGSVDWCFTTNANYIHAGTCSIRYDPGSWDACYIAEGNAPFKDYVSLDFWVNGGPSGGQNIHVLLNPNVDQPQGKVDVALTTLIGTGSVPANTWKKASLRFSDYHLNGTLEEFQLKSYSSSSQNTIYFDDIVLIGNQVSVPVEVTVDTAQNRKPISRLIYGVNDARAQHFASVRYPFNRLGGNARTRYNWEKGITNRANDWYFLHTPDSVSNEASLPEGTDADQFVDVSNSAGADTMLTANLIGWAAKDVRDKKWSFSIAKYGPQTGSECDQVNPCASDAGTGWRTSTLKVTGNDPLDCNKIIDPTYNVRWMEHLTQRGTPQRYLSLDNEPMLWSLTHFDIHPNDTTYDELWQRTVNYAGAIKDYNSSILTFGPVLWSFCAYISSAAGDCSRASAENANHGGLDFVEWYAKQVHDHEVATGKRLVDYLDIHAYPEAPGVALSSLEDDTTVGLRFRSIRSLYDPTYREESWISDIQSHLNLINWMKNIIGTRAPHLKFSISEWNWGNDNINSAAVASAEVMAVFGREGVDAATRWEVPNVGSRVEQAFRMYLNYDGQGSTVDGDSVSAVCTDIDKVGSYAIHSAVRHRLFVLLFNKEKSIQNLNVTITNGLQIISNNTIEVFGFSPAESTIRARQSVQFNPSLQRFAIQLPARSATLAVLQTHDEVPSSSSSSSSNAASESSEVLPSGKSSEVLPSGKSSETFASSQSSESNSDHRSINSSIRSPIISIRALLAGAAAGVLVLVLL